MTVVLLIMILCFFSETVIETQEQLLFSRNASTLGKSKETRGSSGFENSSNMYENVYFFVLQ
jgi:hypothetical protein